MASKIKTKPAYLAGQWYTDNPAALQAEVKGLIAGAKPAGGKPLPDQPLLALIAPHAGLSYSGRCAANGYSLLEKGKYATVVVLGLAHRTPYHGASVPDVDVYDTPLGPIPLDVEAIERLKKEPLFQCLPRAHAGENSVELQLPFLKERLGEFKLIPILFRDLTPEDYGPIAESIRRCVPGGALFVASTDFTHYGASFGYAPFRKNVRQELRKLNDEAFEAIAALDAAAFARHLRKTGNTICGRDAVAVLLQLLPKDAKGVLLNYETSGDASGDWSHVVAYASFGFFGDTPIADVKGPAAAAGKPQEKTGGALTEAEKLSLMRLARRSLEQAVKERGAASLGDDEMTPTLREKRGAFVTLEKHDNLRGCIGYILPRVALHEAVAQNAVNAALHDPRFPAVGPAELGDIEIEISVLSVPREVPSLDDFVVGRHGLIIEKNFRSAVFLPQVAPEQGWDRVQTARHLCVKAGLPADAWKEGMTFKVFTAEVFSEKPKAGE